MVNKVLLSGDKIMPKIHLRKSGFTAQWFASIVYRFFDKKSSSFNTSATHQNKFKGDAAKSEVMPNPELAEELHKPIIRKFDKKSILVFKK